MPQFHYKAITRQGENRQGQIEAADEKEAARLLRSDGLLVTDIGASKTLGFIHLFSGKVPLTERIIFTRQLAVMMKSGLPLVQAISALQEQTENKNLARILGKVNQDVKGGTALSKSLAKYPAVFPPIYTNVVKSGEKSGKMEEVLNNMADQLEKDADLIARVRSAMIYPAVVLVALLGVIFLIVFFIMPQLKSVFADLGGNLPLTTVILLGASDILRRYILFFIIGFIAAIILVKRWVATSTGRRSWDTAKMRIPVFGPLAKKIYMARFSRTLSMLIAAGLPMLDAIETVKGVINNVIYQQSFDTISKSVENGIPLSKALGHDKNFSPMVVHLVTIGEQSGNLDYVLGEIAKFYDKEVENTTRNLSSLIEPMLMVIMGIGVGFVVASVLSPIYNLVGQM